jgi:CheY-like chemotaxis protein
MKPMKPMKILVIDDDDGVREIIQFSLEAAAGWDVLIADSGQRGLERAEAEQPNAILLDVMMPDMDGAETFRQFQANSAIRHIPIIFLTAKAKSSELKRFANLGVAGVITKPIKAQALVEQIKAILHWNG